MKIQKPSRMNKCSCRDGMLGGGLGPSYAPACKITPLGHPLGFQRQDQACSWRDQESLFHQRRKFLSEVPVPAWEGEGRVVSPQLPGAQVLCMALEMSEKFVGVGPAFKTPNHLPF